MASRFDWHRAPGIPGALRLEEVRWAALHIDETLRMSALALLCTDVRVTTVPVAAEIDLLKEVCRSGAQPSMVVSLNIVVPRHS